MSGPIFNPGGIPSVSDSYQPLKLNEENVIMSTPHQASNAPKKRVLFYGLVITFFTLIWLTVDMLVSFLTDLTRNDRLWSYLKCKMNDSNEIHILNM